MNGEQTQFKKGQSGNKKGRPKLPPAYHEFKKMTAEKYHHLIEKYFVLTLPEIKFTLSCQTDLLPLGERLTAIEHWLLKCFETGIETGDYSKLEAVLTRVIGKPKQEIELDIGDKKIAIKLNIEDEVSDSFNAKAEISD